MEGRWCNLLLLLTAYCSLVNVADSKKSGFVRKLCHQYNYCGSNQCDDRSGGLNYVRASGKGDDLHYAWTMVGYPTLFISRTPHSENEDCTSGVTINNWQQFVSDQSYGSLDIAGARGNFSFALIFKSFVEFTVNTKKYPAVSAFDPTKLDDYYIYELNNDSLVWGNQTGFGIVGRESNKTNGTMQLTFKINPRPADGYEKSYFPKPWFTVNSTTFDFYMNYFMYNKSSDRSRLALEVAIVQGPGVPDDKATVHSEYSKDDEYTPSVFYTKTYTFSNHDGDRGFLQWKPITYLNGYRRSSRSQQANAVLTAGNDTSISGSLAEALFGEGNVGYVKTMYLVFGTANDDSGVNSGMYTWTGSMGYGEQPKEKFSTLVILVIIIGLGIPAVLTLLAIVFVFSLTIYRHMRSRNGYTVIK